MNALLVIYLAGVFLSLLMFLVMYLKVASLEDYRNEFGEIKKIFVHKWWEYSLFWPWRWIGFPLYCKLVGKFP